MSRLGQDLARAPVRDRTGGVHSREHDGAAVPAIPSTAHRGVPDVPAPPVRRALGGMATVAMMGGALLLAFAVYQMGGSDLAERRHQRRLLAQLKSRAELAQALAAAPSVDGRTTALPPARPGDAVALLNIASINLERVVVEGTGTQELALGPGHHRSTPLPGQAGNAVIFGHRTLSGGAFRDLDKLRKGDDVEVVTPDGEFTYDVEAVERIRPGQRDVLGQSFLNRLVLVTAYPEDRAEERLAVFARLAGPAVAPPSDRPRPPPETQELGLAGDSASWPGVFGWGASVVAALVVTRRLYQRWLRGPTWLLTTPVLVALTLLWFESLARLFPSTV